MILNKLQVDQMTAEECQKHLKLLDKNFPMTQTLHRLTPEQFAQADDIVNTLLWLEDRMRYIQQSENAINANKIKYGKE